MQAARVSCRSASLQAASALWVLRKSRNENVSYASQCTAGGKKGIPVGMAEPDTAVVMERELQSSLGVVQRTARAGPQPAEPAAARPGSACLH